MPSPSAEDFLAALFPRTVGASQSNLAKRALAGTLDAASLPGRAYSALWHRYDEPMLQNMARTGATPGMPLAANVAEGMVRDPLTLLSAPVGGVAGAGGRALASRVGGALLKRAFPLAADAAANAGLSALSQYGTEGRVDPGAIAANAGLGLGIQGLGSAAMKMAPKGRAAVMDNPNFRKWFGDSKVVDEAGNPLVVYHGGKSIVDDFSRGPYRGILGAGYFSDSPRTAMQYAIAGGSPQKNESLSDLLRLMKKQAPNRTPVVTKAHLSIKNPVDITSNNAYREIFETFTPQEIDEITQGVWIGDKLDRLYQDGDINEWKPFLETIKDDPEMFRGPTGANDDFAVGNSPAFNFLATTGQLDEFMKRRGYDGFIFPDQETGTNTYVPLSPTQIKSATGNRGTFDPNDPNITHFAGGQSPVAGANTLLGRYFRGMASPRDERDRK